MIENFSLAEQAVQALELVRNMDAGMALMNPERHSKAQNATAVCGPFKRGVRPLAQE